ncbi:hypothetical protein FRB90_010488 [Tulasnella sp. 427]|nr:hypothetical protein FRB90_010488 [Tulasnella sp. 427]
MTRASWQVLSSIPLQAIIFDDLIGQEEIFVALAACCKTFAETALDLRWRREQDFRRLVWIWLTRGVIEEGDGVYTFARSPDPEDWSRLLYYCQRVQVLEVRLFSIDVDYAPGPFARGFFEQGIGLGCEGDLQCRVDHSALFPQLTRLTWWTKEPDDLIGCQPAILASPRLAASTL